MATVIPITLVGNNLGQRHKYLNSLINECYKNGEDFEIIKSLPEESHIDRIFKIELACKTRDVEYIIQTLKDDDMLYVSRALKSKWLLEPKYEEIINPEHLENQVYPEMITTAVNKLQHWIYLNLNDEIRCIKFFQFYRESNFDLAIKFLVKCSKEFIEKEFKQIIYNVTPHYLKVISEKSRLVIKMFFDTIATDAEVKRLYLMKENAYLKILRHFLKTDPDLVLNITEKYFNNNVTDRFSSMQSKYIIKNHRDRFWNKLELYTGWLLNMQAIADRLKPEEAKELVLKLARAKYLHQGWFDYKRVEPLIKRLKPEDRAAFKKQVFVEKNIGDVEEIWPYTVPAPPANEINYVIHTIFDDRQPEPGEYENLRKKKFPKRLVKKKRGPRCENVEIMCCEEEGRGKTLLDKLFDEYRFVSFGQTLYELRKRIAAESSPKNREYMMFVLISKTGGRPDAIALLLELLERHSNEPVNVRAAVIRSLVKRAQVWRVPAASWDQLMKFGQGLGLDGKEPEADCNEGLHAVVIRNLLQNGNCEPDIKNAFFKQFSKLNDYNLNSSEKKIISEALPKVLLNYVKENEDDISVAGNYIEKLFETLKTYKVKIDTYPGFIDAVITQANKKSSIIDFLIQSLFDAKICRKQLFPFTLYVKDECYLNALKHDITILDENSFVDEYLSYFILRADAFFRKMSVYFSENNGIGSKYLKKLQSNDTLIPTKKGRVDTSYRMRGRLIAFLLNNRFESYLHELNSKDDRYSKLLSSAIKANLNLARPSLNIDTIDWQKIGPKHVGNKLIKCRKIDIDNNISKLLQWKRTARSAFTLSKRTNYENDVFAKLAETRPTLALKTGLKLIKQRGDEVDLTIWETTKPIIQTLDFSKIKYSHYLAKQLENIDAIPLKIKPAYSAIVYTSLLNIDLYYAMPSLCHTEILLPEVDEQFVENVVAQFLHNSFIVKTSCDQSKDMSCACMYVRILVKYLLLCITEEEQNRKFKKYFDPFLIVMEELRETNENKKIFDEYFQEFLLTLKYSKVFLSTQYVSPLPAIEKLVVWMKKHYSMVEHFKIYAEIHMLMLFYKAVQQALQLVPHVFSDKKQRTTKGVEIAGKIFGQYIASEVGNLQEQYFESIPELYIHSIVAFLQTFHNNYYVSSDLLFSIIQGFFDKNLKSASRLAIYLMTEKRDNLSKELYKDLVKYMNNIENIETQFLLSGFLM